MNILIDSDIPYIRNVFEPYASVSYCKGSEIDNAACREVNILIIRTRTRCDARLLEGTAVKIIATATIGTDHIDIEYCEKHGIKVFSAPGCNARGVLQWVAAALAAGPAADVHPAELTLGVVGTGAVGSLVADYCDSWGFRVLRCDPPLEEAGGHGFVSWEQTCTESDILTFHVPLTYRGDHATYHLLDDDFVTLIRKQCTIINSSRGEIAPAEVLLSAVSRKEASLLIDTWENEPHIDGTLLTAARFATPHIAGYSAQGKANATTAVVRQIASYLDLPLTGWYPADGPDPTLPQAISWENLKNTITGYFDIGSETRRLKEHPEEFEDLRKNYKYREEYF